MVLSQEALEILVSSYCCFFYGAVNTFRSLVSFSSSFIGDPMLSQLVAVSIHLCMCEALAEPLRRQLYHAPVNKLLLLSSIVSEFAGCVYGMDPQVVHSLDDHSFISAPHFVSVTPSMGVLFPLPKKDGHGRTHGSRCICKQKMA